MQQGGQMVIAFIGGGNMATALIGGLMRSGKTGLSLRVADPSEAARKRLQLDFGVATFRDAAAAAEGADVVVLAVKPQVMPEVLGELCSVLAPGQLLLSVAAGITITSIAAAVPAGQAIVRSMPNAAALVGEGIAGLCAGPHCRPHHRDQAERVLKAVGLVAWVPEEAMMDAVTAISGSGPAYFFLLTEALAQAGARAGLPVELAEQLARQTLVGAGAVLQRSAESATALRQRVTSPAGTTEAAIRAFESAGFAELVYAAVRAAELRGRELSQSSP